MRLSILSPLVVLVVVARGPAIADPRPELTLIAHPDLAISSVSRETLQHIYLKRVLAWGDGTAARPVDLADRAVRDRFIRTILRKTPAQVKTYWNQQIFSGKAIPPRVVDSAEAAIAFVLANPGAIAYVPADVPLPKRVKVIALD